MKRPVPPSNFASKDALTRVDLDRLRRGYQDLLDWIDANQGNVDLSAYGTIASNDARYLLRAANDFNTFTHAGTPSVTDRVLMENGSTGAKEYALLSEIAAVISSAPTFDPATLSPLHRWRASQNSQTGGLVDSLTDSGSTAKNFTASGSNRCAVGTDGLGNTYLDMAGSSIYSAGAAADWAFLSNGSPFTIFVVFDKHTWTTNTFSALLATMTYSSGGSGMRLEFGQQTNNGSGPSPLGGSEFGIYAGSGRILLPSYQANPPTTIQAYVWQYNGYSKAQQSGEFSTVSGSSILLSDFRLWQQGRQQVTTQHNSTGSFASSCDTALTLGAFGSGSGFSKLTGRVYEIMILNRCVGDQHVLNLMDYAAASYGVTF